MINTTEDDSDESFLHAFQSASLPFELWNHKAHLRYINMYSTHNAKHATQYPQRKTRNARHATHDTHSTHASRSHIRRPCVYAGLIQHMWAHTRMLGTHARHARIAWHAQHTHHMRASHARRPCSTLLIIKCRMTYLTLLKHEHNNEEAYQQIKQGITHFNSFHAEKLTVGFHETITRFVSIL